VQTAAMGVLLGSKGSLKHPTVVSAITGILNEAEHPILRGDTATRSIVYSPRHDGLALALARYLRPVWSRCVTRMALGNAQILNVPLATLETVKMKLEGLKRFTDEYVDW
jgi:nuclear pore complex protein Nup155